MAGRLRPALLAALLSLASGGCVSVRQFSDLEFQPPKGHYRLLVLRPDVTVGSVTTGGMIQPRADWTEQARTNLVAALQAQQAANGGRIFVAARRDSVAGVPPAEVADLERLQAAVTMSIALHRYAGYALPSKRHRGLDYTLGDDAVRFGREAGYDYALFLHAEDSFAEQGRVALQVLGIAGCFIGFCAPNVGGGGELAYASLVDLRTGEVVWFNLLTAGTQVAGIKMGDIRSPAGASQMIERLMGRMTPGRSVRLRNKRS